MTLELEVIVLLDAIGVAAAELAFLLLPDGYSWIVTCDVTLPTLYSIISDYRKNTETYIKPDHESESKTKEKLFDYIQTSLQAE